MVTQKPRPNKTGEQHNASAGIDETDRKILQLIQDDFPIVSEPWLEISNRLNLKEAEVIKRLKRLIEAEVILRIGPIFDSSKMGLKAATLVAMKVPKNQVDAVAAIINQYENVSHNYEREDKYNVWFTLAAPTSKELAKKLSDIKQKTGVKEPDVIGLPTVNRFKINMHFQLT